MLEDLPIGEGAERELECAGYANRRYISNVSGQTVAVTIIVGPPGPTAVHTPKSATQAEPTKFRKLASWFAWRRNQASRTRCGV